jgi:hypothetical protein
MAAGLAALALLRTDAGLPALLGAELVLGLGYAVINAPISTVAVASMPRQQAGVAAAVASSARNVGLVLGIAVLGSLVQSRLPVLLGDEPFAVAFTDAVQEAYVVASAVAALAFAAALMTLRSSPPGA